MSNERIGILVFQDVEELGFIGPLEVFYKIYDATSGHPTADQLQHDYIGPARRDFTGSRSFETEPQRRGAVIKEMA